MCSAYKDTFHNKLKKNAHFYKLIAPRTIDVSGVRMNSFCRGANVDAS